VADDIGRLDGVEFGPARPTRRVAASATLLPAQRLMLAILVHALNDLQLDGRDGRRARRLSVDANTWFASGDDAWPFSLDTGSTHRSRSLGFERFAPGTASQWGSGLVLRTRRRARTAPSCAALEPMPSWRAAMPGRAPGISRQTS
jgi:hypothetical protein